MSLDMLENMVNCCSLRDSKSVSLQERLMTTVLQVMAVAKDKNGCRFLQRKFDEGGAAAIQAVLPEVLEHLIELMMDPFGNYLIQKLLDRCSEEQRLAVRGSVPFTYAMTLATA